MEFKKSLEELGLTQNEITVYLYLLSKGESLGNQIYKENSLDKSAAYKAIAQLERRGLIISSGDSRNQTYKITPKEKVLTLFDERKKEIDESKGLFLNTFADIEKYSADHYQSENVQVFTGADAHNRFNKELITGNVSLIREIASSDTAHTVSGSKKELDRIMNWFIKERITKKIGIRVMYDSSAVPDEYDVSDEKLLKECRRYPGNLELDSMMSTFGDRVGFTTVKNGKYWALVLKDQLIVNLLNSMYDALWNKSEIVYAK